MHRSAFVAIAGRPSSGKSTLINRFCGAKVSIVSSVPQTTRNAIRGIVTRTDAQLVFVDTPGLHISEKKLNKKLSAAAGRSLADADLVLYLIDGTRTSGPEEEAAALAAARAGDEKLFIALNKIDAAGAALTAVRDFAAARFPSLPRDRVFEVSALTGGGTDALLDAIFTAAPSGPRYYDAECYTDQDLRFRLAEIIREQCILNLKEELPHCVFVEVNDVALRGTKLGVSAVIFCERESQKGMIVGKGGAMIHKIRVGALKECKPLFDWNIELDLRVKTALRWREDDAILRRLG